MPGKSRYVTFINKYSIMKKLIYAIFICIYPLQIMFHYVWCAMLIQFVNRRKESYLKSIVCPTSKLHCTVLIIKWKPSDVNLTGRLENARRNVSTLAFTSYDHVGWIGTIEGLTCAEIYWVTRLGGYFLFFNYLYRICSFLCTLRGILMDKFEDNPLFH